MHSDPPVATAAAPVLAYLLLAEPLSDQDRAALYGRGRGLVPALAEGGPWDALRDILLAARRDALAANTPEAVRQAALDLISALDGPAIAERLVQAAAQLGGIPADLDVLLHAAGPQTLGAVARLLQSQPQSAAAPALRQLAQSLGPDAWHAALEGHPRPSAEDMLALLPLVPALAPSLARSVLHALAERHEPALRIRALALWFAITPWDAATRARWERAVRSEEAAEADLARAALLRLSHADPALLQLAISPELPTRAATPLQVALEARCAAAAVGAAE